MMQPENSRAAAPAAQKGNNKRGRGAPASPQSQGAGGKVVFSIISKGQDAPQVLEFVIEGGVIAPSDLRNIQVPAIDPARPLVLSGRAPHWLYAFLVHEVHFSRILATFEPRLNKGIVVEAPSSSLLGQGINPQTGEISPVSLGGKGRLKINVVEVSNIQVIAVKIEGDRFVEPSVLSQIDWERLRAKLDPSKPIIFYGLAPIWLGASIAAHFANTGIWYGVFDPRLKGVVVVARHHPDAPQIGQVVPLSGEEVEKALASQPKSTKVVAICGDPNSGKSVFLHLLNDALRKRGVQTLTQEGDLFAPTQHWSLFAPTIRRELKRHMAPEERLAWIVNSLRSAKETGAVDVVLVDIGGGRPDIGVRITPENLAILQNVDFVVVVSRNDANQINAWLSELKEKTPHIKVIDVLESVYNPEGHYDFGKQGCVWHLDRTAYANGMIPAPTWGRVEKVAEKIIKEVKS